MSFVVHELPKARQDKESIARWLHERSPAGAAAWIDAYDALIERLGQSADAFGEAPENRDCDFDVRQALFKTRRGRVYRALYVLDGNDAYILRIRGPGQGPIVPEEIQWT